MGNVLTVNYKLPTWKPAVIVGVGGPYYCYYRTITVNGLYYEHYWTRYDFEHVPMTVIDYPKAHFLSGKDTILISGRGSLSLSGTGLVRLVAMYESKSGEPGFSYGELCKLADQFGTGFIAWNENSGKFRSAFFVKHAEGGSYGADMEITYQRSHSVDYERIGSDGDIGIIKVGEFDELAMNSWNSPTRRPRWVKAGNIYCLVNEGEYMQFIQWRPLGNGKMRYVLLNSPYPTTIRIGNESGEVVGTVPAGVHEVVFGLR